MSEKPSDRKQEILMAALEAFTSRGYDKTSMDDIVRISGLSKGTLYWHFENKQALFSGLITMVIEQFMGAFDEVVHQAQDLSPIDALYLLFSGTADFLEANPRFTALTTDFFLQAWHDEQVKALFTGLYIDYIKNVALIIQKGIDAGELKPMDADKAAAAIVGALDGIALQKLLEMTNGDAYEWNIRAVLDMAGSIMVDGLVKRSSDD